MASFDRITDFIYLGSAMTTRDEYHRVRAHGIRACVDMKREGADPWGFDAFLWLPTTDHDAPTRAALHLGMAFLKQCEASQMPVIVHCAMGVGRSPALVLAHLLAGPFLDRPITEVLSYVCARRACVSPNRKQLEAALDAASTFGG